MGKNDSARENQQQNPQQQAQNPVPAQNPAQPAPEAQPIPEAQPAPEVQPIPEAPEVPGVPVIPTEPKEAAPAKPMPLTAKEKLYCDLSGLVSCCSEVMEYLEQQRDGLKADDPKRGDYSSMQESLNGFREFFAREREALHKDYRAWSGKENQKALEEKSRALAKLTRDSLLPAVEELSRREKLKDTVMQRARLNQIAQLFVRNGNEATRRYNDRVNTRAEELPLFAVPPSVAGQEELTADFRREKGVPVYAFGIREDNILRIEKTGVNKNPPYDTEAQRDLPPGFGEAFPTLKGQQDFFEYSYKPSHEESYPAWEFDDGGSITKGYDGVSIAECKLEERKRFRIEYAEYQCEVIESMGRLFDALEPDKLWDAVERLDRKKLDKTELQMWGFYEEVDKFIKDEKFTPVRESLTMLRDTVKRSRQGKMTEDKAGDVIDAMSLFGQAVNNWKKKTKNNKELFCNRLSVFQTEVRGEGRGSVRLGEFLFKNPALPEPRTVRVEDAEFVRNSENRFAKKLADNETIFPDGGPRPEDVEQDTNGPCYMLGNLRSLAEDPKRIRDLIEDNGDGTVTVHFFDARNNEFKTGLKDRDRVIKEPLDVVIDKTLPKTDRHSAPWVRLVEKAYVASRIKNTVRNRDGFSVDTDDKNIDMKKLGWGHEGMFYGHISPVEQRSEDHEKLLLGAGSLTEAKKRYADILREAQRNKATVTVATAKHCMAFEGVETDKKTGKDVVKYYDQYYGRHHRVTVDELLTSGANLTKININYPANAPRPRAFSLSPVSDAQRCAEQFGYISRNSFRKTVCESALPGDINRAERELLENSPAVRKLLDSEFPKFEGRASAGRLAEALKRDRQFGEKLCRRVLTAFRDEVREKPIKGEPKLAENLDDYIKRRYPDEPAREKGNAFPDIQAPEKLEKLRSCYEKLKTLGEGRSNSPEFTAMTDALRDVCQMSEEKGIHPNTLELLEERAFAKTNLYFRSRNPYTDMGKQRKDAAEAAMSTLRSLHPGVSQELYHLKEENVFTELACQYAESCGANRITKLTALLSGNGGNETVKLKAVAARIPTGGSGWSFYEKTCGKGMAEAMQKLTFGEVAEKHRNAAKQQKREKETASAGKKLGVTGAVR